MPGLWMLVFVAVVALFAMTVQGVIGFAGGVLAIPILLWAGLPLPFVVGLLTPIGAAQCVAGLIRYRDELYWRDAVGITAARFMTLPVGVWLMSLIVVVGPQTVKLVVGLGVLIVVAIRVGLRIQPQARVHPAWTVVAGCASGLTAGMVGMGGPPMVLWVTAHDWTAGRVRTVTWLSIAAMAPVIIGLLALRFGRELMVAAAIGLAMTPTAVIGMSLAAWLNQWVNAARLRQAMVGTLVMIGCVLIVQAWI